MRVLITAVALAGAAAAAFADETRELGAHEHGTGSLTIAVEGDRIAMELEAPGFDIVGFEHAPGTEEEQAVVEAALAQLRRADELFRFSDAAACSVTDASVEELADDHHKGEHGEVEHGDEAHAEDEGHEAGARHTEFHASYTIACADPGALSAIEFPYFDVFPNAEALDLQMATDAGATSVAVDRGAPSLDLSGMM
jgi:hypothetical protein